MHTKLLVDLNRLGIGDLTFAENLLLVLGVVAFLCLFISLLLLVLLLVWLVGFLAYELTRLAFSSHARHELMERFRAR